MDIDTLKDVELAEQGAVMEIEDPVTGESELDHTGKPVTMTFVGIDSKKYRDAQRRLTDGRMQKMQRGVPFSAAVQETESRDLIASCCTAWTGFYSAGEPLACTKENVVKVFKLRPSIQEQADRFIAKRANFFQASKTS